MNWNDRPNWRECVDLAEHYLAVGQTELYLSTTDDDKPWGYITSIRPGGGHRLDIDTNIGITAEHPCGLSFCWNEDIEKSDANGRRYYMIDLVLARRILSHLDGLARQEFREYLKNFAAALLKNAAEFREIADREHVEAVTLSDLAGYIVQPRAGDTEEATPHV